MTLPVAEHPKIAPPKVKIQAEFPGASAQILGGTVAPIIETAVNDAEGMSYIDSSATDDDKYRTRQAIGQVSFGGMVTATVAGCLLVPPFYAFFQILAAVSFFPCYYSNKSTN